MLSDHERLLIRQMLGCILDDSNKETITMGQIIVPIPPESIEPDEYLKWFGNNLAGNRQPTGIKEDIIKNLNIKR